MILIGNSEDNEELLKLWNNPETYNMVKVNNIWEDNMNTINVNHEESGSFSGIKKAFDSEVTNKGRTNQPPFLKANYKSANINAGLLFSLSKAGRAVLAYVIDKMDIAKGDVIFPKVDILNYISNNADLGATTTTVNRGIKDLIDNGVFIQDEHIDSLYHVNKDLVWQ